MNSLTGGGPADDLLDRGTHQLRLRLEPGELVLVLDQSQQTTRDRSAGGVVAGAGDNHVIGQAVNVVEGGLTVERGVGDRRGEVLGRVGSALGGERGEVLEEVEDDGVQFLRVLAATELVIVAAEQLLGELEHAAEVGFRQPEQRQDDVQREVDRDLLDEVALGTLLDHLVDVDLGQFVDAGLQCAHGLRPEPVGADLADVAVQRVVHVDQRAQATAGSEVGRGQIVGGGGLQHRTRGGVDPQLVVAFDRHHVGVLGDGPEGPVVGHLDVGDGGACSRR